jgi:hypothetical protein
MTMNPTNVWMMMPACRLRAQYHHRVIGILYPVIAHVLAFRLLALGFFPGLSAMAHLGR